LNGDVISVILTSSESCVTAATPNASVNVTVTTPPTANAGADAAICATSTVTLNGSIGGSATSAVWSGGTCSFSPNNTSLNAVYTPSAAEITAGTVTLTLTTNDPDGAGGCTTAQDDVVITINAEPSDANAGPDQSNVLCSATLDGNIPAVGTGLWSFAPGGNTDGLGVIVTPSSNATTFNGSPGVTYTLRWRISNGACTAKQDLVSIGFDPSGVTPANAGIDQSNCNSGTFTLSGNPPTVGTGQWSIVGTANGAVITDPTLRNSTVTGLTASSSVTLRWTISNSTCSSFDDVVLTNLPPTSTANAGPDQSICGSTTTLAAFPPAVGTGTWTITAGTGGTIASPSSPTSGFTGVRGQVYTLRWRITNGTCPSTEAFVTVTLLQDPSAAQAGSDQLNVCGTITLGATAPTIGVGQWSFAPSNAGTGGAFDDVNVAATTFNGTPGQSYTLRWTVSNGSCTSNTDDVLVTFNATGVSPANAGIDQQPCSNSTVLAATTPTIGTGIWSFDVGGNPDGLGAINDVNNQASLFSGTLEQTYVLVWTVTNGACVSTDRVSIAFKQTPSTANAGTNQSNCKSGNFTLAATPPTIGTGKWSIVGAANGATIADENSPTSAVSGLNLNASVTLRWTVSNGSCTPSTSDVVLTNSGDPSAAVAGVDISECPTDPNPIFTLGATPPAIGIGQWSVISGTATLSSTSSPTAEVSGIPINSTAVLRWTVTNGACPSVFDDVSVSRCIGGGTGNCGTVVITPVPTPATCTNSDGSITFNINPAVPVVNPSGVKITITGVSSTNLTIARTNFNDPFFDNIPLGTYNYSIEYGSAACTKTGQVTVDQSGTVGTPVASNIVGPVCAGSSTGALTLDVPGETGNLLQWSLDGVVWNSFIAGNQISGVPAGAAPSFSRIISVRRDASDPCNAAVIVNIQDQFSPITASITPQQSATCNNNDGSVLVSYSGGAGGPYQFALDGVPYTMPTDNIIRNLRGGNHALRVIDNKGCFVDLSGNQFFVPSPGLIGFAATKIDPTCAGNGADAKIVVQIDPTFLPGNYEVAITQQQGSNSTFQSIPLNGTFEFTGLTKSRYFVTVRSSSNACPNEATVDINGGPTQVDFDVEAVPIACFEDKGGLVISDIRGNTTLPYSYEVIRQGSIILNGTITTLQALSDVELTGLDKGNYQVILRQNQSSLTSCTQPISSVFKSFEVTGPTGVLDTLYVVKDKSLPDLPTGSMLIGIQESAQEPYEVKLELTEPLFPSQFFLLDWTEATRNDQNLKVEKSVKNLYAGVYTLQLRDDQGCEKSYLITIDFDTNVSIPNVFTPNGDGVNDVFFIRNLPQDARLIITNRWGNQVYSSSAYQNDWDGGSAADGVYYYRVQASEQTFTGWVEIIRGK